MDFVESESQRMCLIQEKRMNKKAWLFGSPQGIVNAILLALPKLAAVYCGTLLSTTKPEWLHLAILGSWLNFMEMENEREFNRIFLNCNKRKRKASKLTSTHFTVLLTQLCPLNHKQNTLCCVIFSLPGVSLFVSLFVFVLWQLKQMLLICTN